MSEEQVLSSVGDFLKVVKKYHREMIKFFTVARAMPFMG